MDLLKDKVAVVTGAGRGIGRAVALAMAAEGAAVGLAARTSAEIESTAEEIRDGGGRALAVPTDVGRQEEVDALFAQVGNDLGDVDILVANAAVSEATGNLWEIDPNEWQRMFEINVLGVARCARAVLPAMIQRRYGKIIIVGSKAARSETWASRHNEQMGYAVTKAAVHRLGELLAEQVKPYAINVNCIGVAADTRLGEAAREAAAIRKGERPPPRLEDIPLEQRVILPEENVAPFIFLASRLGDHITGAYIEADTLPDTMRRQVMNRE